MSGQVVYIGVGSNLDDPIAQSRAAREQLEALSLTTLFAVSSLYRSKPMGPANQPRYVNSVICLSTLLEPNELLDCTQSIEDKAGRDRTVERWGARTLDLDILLYSDKQIKNERLTVPHVGLTERSFVLLPLLEIAPDIVVPGKGRASQFLSSARDYGVEKLELSDYET